MTKLDDLFHTYLGSRLDISEHLGLLRGLAVAPEVKRIVEIGFRKGISATALCTAGKPVVAYDIEPCKPHCVVLRRIAPHFEFRQADSLKVEIPECELLHIDSLHTYTQLSQELELHHGKVAHWIALHDTTTFGEQGQDKKKPGLQAAVSRFLMDHPEWRVHLSLRNNNGFTLLRRQLQP